MKKMETCKKCQRKESKQSLIEAISKDLRQVGIFLMGIGQLGLMINADKITGYEGLLVILVGIVFWVIGLYYSHVSSEISSINEK